MHKKITLCALAVVLSAVLAAWWITSRTAVEKSSPLTASLNTAAPAASMAAAVPRAKVDSIDVLAERLRDRLAKEPDDMNGWVLLARSYHYLERWDDAKAAFAKAKSLGYQGEADTLTSDAAATRVASSSENPTNSTAETDPVFETVGRVVQQQVAQIQAGAETVTAKTNDSAVVQVRVSVAPAVQASVGADTTVFIFARASQGPRMPLAAVRKTLRDLPVDIRLDDSSAMLPTAKLSDVIAIVVGARISRSGNAVAQPDDIEVLSQPLSDWHGQRVQLVLNGKL